MRARIKTFGRYKYLLKNLIVKDVKLKYRRSILGILWSVLNPLLMMLVISAVFSSIFKVSVENFPVYYLTGSTLFNMLAETTNSSMTSILDSSSLIKKVYIPKYNFWISGSLDNSAFSNSCILYIGIFNRFGNDFICYECIF